MLNLERYFSILNRISEDKGKGEDKDLKEDIIFAKLGYVKIGKWVQKDV